MTIQIGNITLENNVLLAPLSGISDLPFRRLVKSFGAGLVVSEMIASRAMIMETRESLLKAKNTPEEFPMAVQIAGCEPDVMAEAARLNEDRGAALIDINFGCPVKKVTNGYAGSALLRDEPLACKILEAVAKAVKIPVTLKMRLGWDYTNLNAPIIAKRAEEVGIKMITVHGRTRCQMYNGQANWELIRMVKDSVKIPLIANGDITKFEDVDDALRLSGADGVMIGRGAYGKPWFLRQVIEYLKGEQIPAAPIISEQKQLVLQHYEEMLLHYGEQVGIRFARKHVGWYTAGMTGSAAFRNEFNKVDNAQLALQKISDFYDGAISGSENRA
jgi:tRNA-dihydrouridine synthase B